MRPELKAINAHMCKMRREKERTNKAISAAEHLGEALGYARGVMSTSGTNKKISVAVRLSGAETIEPFEKRMEIVKEKLSYELAKNLNKVWRLDHIKEPFDAEIWEAEIEVVDISRRQYKGHMEWL